VLAGRTIAVVVPAYNEAVLVESTLAGIPSFVDHIIVVDDASVDGTPGAVRESKRTVELLEHAINQGVGSAITTGCTRAFFLGADFTAVMAADGQMDPTDLPALLAPLIADQADYVKGNRLAWPGARRAMPRHRWLGNHLFSALTRVAVGVDVRDSQCGYVAMNRRTQQAFDWSRLWRSYGYPNDLLSWLSIRDLRVREIPVRPIYGEEKSGIRLRHVFIVIPLVIMRAWLRGLARSRRVARWATRTSRLLK